ncbi:MAG TPA: 4Fe-4S dicluster domain-containing protein, partial [Phycisphaerae bacterium]|nr:4Fe-4S dicluster domain-containing protein [Phycisphaerae bacterium]
MFRRYERKSFDAEKCTRCGACLSECPVMRLPEAEARLAIEDLIACLPGAINRTLLDDATPGKAACGALRKCTSCFACNLVCPEDCRPANLFLNCWHRQYEKEGLPVRARYFLPHSVPNFRTHVLDRLPADEKRAVESWKDLAPVDEIFYPGCNIITTPYLTFSKLFDG